MNKLLPQTRLTLAPSVDSERSKKESQGPTSYVGNGICVIFYAPSTVNAIMGKKNVTATPSS